MTPDFKRRSGSGPRRSGGGSAKSAAQGNYAAAEELHPIEEPPNIERFTEWPLDEFVQRAIANMQIEVPTPIQRLAIGPVLEGRDVIAKAETGTGKTLAFGAPMVSKLDSGRASVLGLVLCPTRELAQQVGNVLRALGQEKGLKVALVVGGDPMQPQIKELQAGAQVVVGTPGRVLDLMKQRFLSFPWTEFVVLDEADEMLEIGFLDDVEAILNATPEERQTLLFSATFPPPLLALARKHTKDPAEMATARGLATVDRIEQSVCFVSEEDRPHELRRLLLASKPSDLFLVFCERRMEVDRLMRRLERLPVGVKALHGGYDQEARFRVMSAFRGGEVRALVATDVASRGLDVTGVTHVINYSPPRDISDYTHRIGRTGRAGRSGKAFTFVAGGEGRRWGELVSRMTWPVTEIEPRLLISTLLEAPEGSAPAGNRPRPARDGDATAGRQTTPRESRESRETRSPERQERAPRRERPEPSAAVAFGAEEAGERPARSRRPRAEPAPEQQQAPRAARPAPRETAERPERQARPERQERQERQARPERQAPRPEAQRAAAEPVQRASAHKAAPGEGTNGEERARLRAEFERRRAARAEKIRQDRLARRELLGLDAEGPVDQDRDLRPAPERPTRGPGSERGPSESGKARGNTWDQQERETRPSRPARPQQAPEREPRTREERSATANGASRSWSKPAAQPAEAPEGGAPEATLEHPPRRRRTRSGSRPTAARNAPPDQEPWNGFGTGV